MEWVLLGWGAFGLALTINAFKPLRWPAALGLVSFFAGWLTADLPVLQFLAQGGVAVALVSQGALDAWPGWLGLGITLLSWLGLFALMSTAERTRDTVERALVRGLGDDYSSRISPGLAARTAEPAPRGASRSF